MKKINILYLHAGAELYGADKVLLSLISNINKNKFFPIVVLPNDGPLVEEIKKKGVDVYIEDYPILRRKFFNLKGIFAYPFQYMRSYIKLSKYIRKFEIDLVHVNTTAVLQGIFIKIFLKKKIVWHIHEILENPHFLFKLTSFFIGKYADDVVVVSKAVKNHLISSKLIKESKVSVVYNGVDNTIYNSNHDINYLYDEFGLSKNNIVIGMVGRVNSWKGQEHFLQAISSILKKNSDVYGILVGGVFDNESYRMENLKNQIADLNISQQVIVEDFRNDIPAIYDLFDIFVLPSTNPDPLPTVVLEAMASGKPVIGYSHGGVTEMVENGYNGFLCEVNNVKDLEQKIDFLISNEKVRKEMANNSSTRQKKYFSLESYINNFEKLYSSRCYKVEKNE